MSKKHIFKLISLLMIIFFTFSGCKVSSIKKDLHVINNLIQYKDGNKWGVINTKGDYVVEPSYDSIRISDNGYIYCSSHDK